MSYGRVIQINVAGPSFQSRAVALANQRTKNLYPEVNKGAKVEFVLMPTPGLESFGSTTAGDDRGLAVMAGVLYRVVGQTLYSVASTGAHTSIGAITGTERCTFANDGVNLVICSDGAVWVYDGATITAVADTDIDGAVAVAWLNSQYIYTKPNLFVISDVGQPAVASGLNAAQAESQPDDLVRAYVYDENVFMFGEESTELWYNTGEGSPPFDRITGGILSVGLGAMHSPAHTDNGLYFLGDDRRVYFARGGSFQVVSGVNVANAFEGYADISDAIGTTYTLQGQNFYFLTFPTAGRTWVLSESIGADGWFEMSYGTEDAAHRGTSIVACYGKTIVADADNGALYTFDLDTYTDGGAVIQRQRQLAQIHGAMLGAPGQRIKMSYMDFMVQTGVGLISGQGEAPRMMVEYSIDDSIDWAHGGWVELGRMGQYQATVRWDKMLSFMTLNIRITFTDPCFFGLFGAAIAIKHGGWR